MYAVLFDIDGTLLLTAGAGMKAFAAAFAELFEVQQLLGDVPFAGRSDRAIAPGVDAHSWHRADC